MLPRPARPAVAVFLTACLLAAAGCSTAKARQAARPPALTAWQQVLGEIGPEGTAGAATALKAFALALGPLPAMRVPSGSVGQIRSGSIAIRWIVGHWAEITAEQRAAAVRLVPELGKTGSGTHNRVMPAAYPAAYQAPKRPPTYYQVLAMQMADEIEAHVHVRLTLKLRAAEGRTQQTIALADTGVYNAAGGDSGGKAASCVITVSAKGAAEEIPDLEDTIGHEVWHCYQGQILGVDAYYNSPSWLIEGQAEWVGDSLRPAQTALSAWFPYATLPGKTLFTRSYDAIGFYSHLTESGVDTWLRLIPMLAARSNEARYDAAGATSDVFLDTWASTFFRESSYGGAWEMNGPGLPTTRPSVRPVLSVANGGGKSFNAPAYANAVYALSSNADVLTFTVNGHARLADPAKHADYVLGSGESFCTKDGGCTCPEGSTYQGPDLKTLAPESALAVTGGPSGSNGAAAGQSLDDFCKKAETKLALPDQCKIVSQADASKAAGKPARPGIPSSATLEGSTVEGLGTGPGCIYRDAGSPSATYGIAYVRVDVYDLGAAAAATLVSYRGRFAGIPTSQVKGLGDDNFYFSINGPTHLYVRRANLIMHFAVLTADGLNQATQLAKIVLGRL